MAVSGRKLTGLTESVLKGSTEDFDHKCDPCLAEDGQHVEAQGFCVDCQEYLCQSCLKFHQRTKALKHHELLDKANMTKGKTSATVFTERCSTHKNEVIKFFCPKHEALGCTDCITMDHRTCEIDYIPDECAGIGDSEEYTIIIKKLDQKLKEAYGVYRKAEARDKEIESQHENALKEIAKFRKEVNDRLDELEKKVNEIANKRKITDKKQIKVVLDTCTSISSNIKKLQTSLEESKLSNRNGQLYITIKRAKSKLKSDEIEMVDHSLEKVDTQYHFEHGKDLEDLLSKQDGFGKLSSTVTAPTRSKAEPSKSLSFLHVIKIKSESDKSFFRCNALACAVLCSNKVVLIDGTNNKKVKIVDTDSKTIVKEKLFDISPSGIAALPMDQIAVTMPDKREIWIMTTTDEIHTLRRIKVKQRCRNITYSKDRLYILCTDPDCILKMDMQGRELNTIPLKKEVFESTAYIVCSRNAELLYVSDSEGDSIVSVTTNGEIIAVYKNVDLCGPKGMTILDDGSLLVCSFRNHSIHRISGDLKEGVIVAERVTDTYSICYNPEQQMIYTTAYNMNHIMVFRLK